MKTLKFLLTGAIALMTFAGCSDDVVEPTILEPVHNEIYYAREASISSSDSNFTVTDNGGVVSFKVSGGEITIDVDCGTEWTAQNSAEDIFGCSIESTSVTITAGQNLVKKEQTGTIKLVTMPSQYEFAKITVTQDAYDAPEITVGKKEWHVPAVGELSTEITVSANEEWQVEKCDDWLTIERTETGIILIAEENTETTEREGEVVLTCADEFKSDSATIKVTQNGRAYITLSEDELLVSSFGSSVSVAVESNFGFECVCDADWLTVSRTEKDGSLEITYAKNETESDRESIVAITAGDGAVNTAEAELKITQSWENFDALILEYTITSKNTTIDLPLCDLGEITIDWGDGKTSHTATLYGSPEHTYYDLGTYTITINGTARTITAWFKGGTYKCNGLDNLVSVKQWGNTGIRSMYYAFAYCHNLESLPEETGDAFANVTTFENAFCGCGSLTSVPVDIFSKCSVATNFGYTFYGCRSLTTVPVDIFSKCSAATNFGYTFAECSKLVSAPSFEGCSAATYFIYAFDGCYSLTTLPENMFSGCAAVTSFYYTFNECTGLTTVPVSLFDDALQVSNFICTFNKCSSVSGESPYTKIDINGEQVKVHIYERSDYATYMHCSNPMYHTNCFKDSTFSDYSSIPSGWK